MPWIIAGLFAVLLGIYSGLGGFFFGGLVGLVGGFFLRWKFFPKKKTKPKKQAPEVPSRRRTGPKLPSIEPRKPEGPGKIQWHPFRSAVKVFGFEVREGMVYLHTGRTDMVTEPSAIVVKSSVSKKGRRVHEPLGYYPSYERMSPNQRAIYLEWLSNGRRVGNPEDFETGYVFVFFYGLERRILLENDSSQDLRREIQELLKIYGSYSGSVGNYFLDLLHFDGYRRGKEEYRRLWPEYLQHSKHLDGEAMKLILANIYERGELLHWTVALRLAPRLDGARKSVVVERSGEKFWQLFQHRFDEQFGEGMPLKVSKRDVWSEYRPASPALLQLTYGRETPFRIKVPHVMGIRSQFKKIVAIWNDCIEELSGYSRALVNHSGKADQQGLKAFQKLPLSLRKPEDHPFRNIWNEILGNCEKEDDFHFVPVSSIATLFGVGERERLTPTQSRNIADHVDGLGFRLAPDPRISKIPLSWRQECCVYRAVDEPTDPSRALVGIVRMLFLTIAVANADGTVDAEELEVFERIAKNEIDSDAELLLLEATGAALLRDTTVAENSLTRMAGTISPARRPLIARYLIQVAAADGVITSDEDKILKRAFRKFELDSDFLEQQVREDSDSFEEVTIDVGSFPVREGAKIPPPPSEGAVEVPAFHIDMSRVAAITTETNEVVRVLSEIMDDGDEEQEETVEEVPQDSGESREADAGNEQWMEELESQYRPVLSRLIVLEEFTDEQIDAISAENNLVSADVIAKVNLWADDALDDFLIEETAGGYLLHVDMIPENE